MLNTVMSSCKISTTVFYVLKPHLFKHLVKHLHMVLFTNAVDSLLIY